MGTTVGFGPISIGATPPGATTIGNTSCAPLSAPANVTASISDDTSGGALTLLALASFITEIETEPPPPPGSLPPGAKPPPPIKVPVIVGVASSNGVTPLAVASGQFIQASVQFAPTASTPATSTATLLIHGDTWNPVSVPITATAGEISVSVPSILVKQGASTKVDVTVKSVAGNGTTVKLYLEADASADAPNVTATLNPTSLSIAAGESRTSTLTVSADSTLATGEYSWSLGVWAFDNTYSFSVSVVITVGEPYYFIQSKLDDGYVIDIVGDSTKAGAGLDVFPQTSGADNQLWQFVLDPAGSGFYYIQSKLNGNVVDIEGASTKPGALLDAFPQKPSAENQLWEFVADPAGSGYFFIVSRLTGMVIDIQGASTQSKALLDVFPLKLSGYDNQLWNVVDGQFPSTIKTVPPPSSGLKSAWNYFMYNGCDQLVDVSVTIDVTQDIVWESSSGGSTHGSVQGFSFQLNCYAPTITLVPPVYSAWQQFVIEVGGGQLVGGINYYQSSGAAVLLNKTNPISWPSVKIPAGYKIKMTLSNDASDNVTGVTFLVIDNSGKTLLNQWLAPQADIAPIIAFEMNLVGPISGESVVLSSGAGTFTYAASSTMTPLNKEPSCAAAKDVRTGETANTIYGVLPANWGNPLTQSFGLSGS
jgi:hypothetical protein